MLSGKRGKGTSLQTLLVMPYGLIHGFEFRVNRESFPTDSKSAQSRVAWKRESVDQFQGFLFFRLEGVLSNQAGSNGQHLAHEPEALHCQAYFLPRFGINDLVTSALFHPLYVPFSSSSSCLAISLTALLICRIRQGLRSARTETTMSFAIW